MKADNDRIKNLKQKEKKENTEARKTSILIFLSKSPKTIYFLPSSLTS